MALFCAGTLAAEVKTVYLPAKNPSMAAIANRLQQSFSPDPFARLIGALVEWPTPLTIAYAECGTENASYHSDKKFILVCYELIARIAEKLPKDSRIRGFPPDKQKAVAGYALIAIILHEAGHAMIDQFDLPVFGREEDVADQLATYLMLKHDVADGILGSILFFSQNKSFFYLNTQRGMSDEHGLGPQRAINIACWAYGKDPSRYAPLANLAGLTAARAPRCEREYLQLEKAVTTLLGNRLTTQASSPVRSGSAKLCSSHYDCGYGLWCNEGQCASISKEPAQSPVSPSYGSSNGRIDSSPEAGSCRTSSDCPLGQTCARRTFTCEGYPYSSSDSTTPVRSCKTSSDCNPGQACSRRTFSCE